MDSLVPTRPDVTPVPSTIHHQRGVKCRHPQSPIKTDPRRKKQNGNLEHVPCGWSVEFLDHVGDYHPVHVANPLAGWFHDMFPIIRKFRIPGKKKNIETTSFSSFSWWIPIQTQLPFHPWTRGERRRCACHPSAMWRSHHRCGGRSTSSRWRCGACCVGGRGRAAIRGRQRGVIANDH